MKLPAANWTIETHHTIESLLYEGANCSRAGKQQSGKMELSFFVDTPNFEIRELKSEVGRNLPLRQHFSHLVLQSEPWKFSDVTPVLRQWLGKIGAGYGTLTLFLKHTSASLTIQENTDSDVQRDILDALELLAPRDRNWRHSLEGPDDMPSHVKSALLGVSLSIPVFDSAMELGTWQAVYLVEHRDQPHRRTICLHYCGSTKGE